MKKLFFIYALMFFVCSGVQAQNLREIFVNMPVELLPLLKENDRLDLIDLYDAKMSTPVTNRLDGKSRMKLLTDDYLLLSLSASSSMQIKMLQAANGDTLLCVVNTVCAEAADSRIQLYKKDWTLVGSDFFSFPSIADFFTPSDSVGDFLELMDIYLVELTLSPDDKSLVAEYTLPRYMAKEDAERVSPFLRKVKYMWNGEAFVNKEL